MAQERPNLPDVNTETYLLPAGEVIESGTVRIVAQCPRERLHAPPDFGAFVKILPPGARLESSDSPAEPISSPVFDPFADSLPHAPASVPRTTPEGTLYALVAAASTGNADMGRRAAAYGLEEDMLRREQPQIFDLLATEFVALPFAYVRNGVVRCSLPPRPPRLHAFVWECASEEVCALTEAPDFVRQILHAEGGASDDLMAACLSHAYACHGEDFDFLVRAGKQLAQLLRDDPERLTALLRKLEP